MADDQNIKASDDTILNSKEAALFDKAAKKFYISGSYYNNLITQNALEEKSHPLGSEGSVQNRSAADANILEWKELVYLGHSQEVRIQSKLLLKALDLVKRGGKENAWKLSTQDLQTFLEVKAAVELKGLSEQDMNELKTVTDQFKTINATIDNIEAQSSQAPLFNALHKIEKGGWHKE